MIKSPTDNNTYHLHNTPNDIKVLQVVDTDSPWCALALSVNSGSYNDPDDCPGLAHLLEHVLFTGSQNFPKDNHILHFLDEHQGKINAWTSTETTTFYFKVHHQYFEEALHIFFDMLLNPLFSHDGIKKECNTIDAEFHNKVSEEQRRVMEVQKETCNPGHPFHRFSVGNNSIFQRFTTEDMAAKLETYWRKHFVANKISVSLLTNQNDPSQLSAVLHYLTSFTRGECYSPPDNLQQLYNNVQLQRHIKLQTKRAHRRLMLVFNQTSEVSDAADIEILVSHLFGYEGEGSLLRYWKSQKWATQVIAGPGLKGSGFCDFNLYIELTETGFEKQSEIIHSVLYYAQLIACAPDIQRHYDEKKQLNKLAFEHRAKQNPLDLVQQLVKNLQQFDSDRLISGDFLMEDFNTETFQRFLSNIRPERLRVITISNQPYTAHSSKWYSVPYEDEPLNLPSLSDEQKSQLQQVVYLPEANPYIPVISDAPKSTQQLPQKVSGTKNNIWAGCETEESQHKGECFFSWRKGNINSDITQIAHRKLYASTLESTLHQDFYQAQIAGLHFHFYAHQQGIGLHISGFAEKQLHLAEQLLRIVYAQPRQCPDFELHKQDYLNSLMSGVQNKPLNRLFTALQALFVPTSWLPEDLATIVSSTSLSDIQSRHDVFFQDCTLESLIYGDWSDKKLSNFINQVGDIANEPASMPKFKPLVYLAQIKERSLHFPCEHQDAALVLYLQTEDKTLLSRARMMLCESILAGYYFDCMRNKKQLGYQVGTGYMPFNEHPGTVLYIQSPVASAEQLYLETLDCLQAFHHWLCQLDSAHWQKYRQNLERQIKQKSINFSVKCQRYWSAIGREKVDFNHEKQLNATIAGLEKKQVCDWFKTHFLRPEQSFALFSQGHGKSTEQHFIAPLSDIYKYK